MNSLQPEEPTASAKQCLSALAKTILSCTFSSTCHNEDVHAECIIPPCRVHAACWRNGPGGSSTTPQGNPAYGTQFYVTFNDVVIIPKQQACFPCDPNDYQCNNPGNSDAEYFAVTGTITAPSGGTGVLKLKSEARSSSHTFIGLLLDAVFIRPQ